MTKRIDTLLAFCLLWNLIPGLSPEAFGQEGYGHFESLTYKYFANQQWDSLVVTGRKALHSGHDYYYLRSRMGTAYLALSKPFRAADNFSRALEFDHSQTYARDGLYRSCLESGMTDQARALTALMTPDEKRAHEVQIPALQNIYVEVGGTLSNAYVQSNPDGLMGSDSIAGEQDLYGNDYYAHLSFTLNLLPNLSLYIGGNYLNFDKRKLFQYSVYKDQLDSTVTYDWGYENFYSFPRQTTASAFNYHITQTEFALGGTLTSSSGVKIMPLFRLLHVGYYNTEVRSSSSTVMDTAYYVSATNTYATFPFTRVGYGYLQRDTAFNNFLVSLVTSRQFGILNLGMGGSWSDLNGQEQAQATAFVTYYPLGNLNLYGTTEVIELVQGTEGRMIFCQMVGGRIWKQLWGDMSVLYGDITNGNLSNGMLVYNNTGKVRYKLEAELIYQVNNTMQFYLNYAYMAQSSPVYYYDDETTSAGTSVVRQTRWMPYQTNSIYFGVKINM